MKKPKLITIAITFIMLAVIIIGCTQAPAPAPVSIDSDGDGWTDSQEKKAGTSIDKKDTDGDGYWDPQDPNPLDPNIPQATPEPPSTPEPSPTPAPTPTPEPSPAPEPAYVFGWDRHHADDVNSWATEIYGYARDKGMQVEFIDVEPLTFDYLKQHRVSILYIPRVSLAYTDKEIQEIQSFVRDGGGLLMVAEGLYSKELLRVFGVELTSTTVHSPTIPIKSDHPLFKGVNVIAAGYPSYLVSYLAISPPAYVLLEGGETAPYRPLFAAAEIDDGRVLVIPSTFHIVHEDNLYLIRNALYWLRGEEVP